MDDEKEKDDPQVQADDNSIAVGGITIGGDVSGTITIGHGYTAEKVSVLLKQITTTLQPKKFDGRCPYKGLDVFEEQDAELFFGRELSKIILTALDHVEVRVHTKCLKTVENQKPAREEASSHGH